MTTQDSTHAPVTFWQVENAQSKLTCVCQLIYKSFQQAQKQIVAVPSQAAAEYLDKILWHYPPGAFVPHTITDRPIPAAVVITTSAQNLNDAGVLINLCTTVSPISESVQTIHELLDKTEESKIELARDRYRSYQKQGHALSVQKWSPQ